jgi:hypothetical protein
MIKLTTTTIIGLGEEQHYKTAVLPRGRAHLELTDGTVMVGEAHAFRVLGHEMITLANEADREDLNAQDELDSLDEARAQRGGTSDDDST